MPKNVTGEIEGQSKGEKMKKIEKIEITGVDNGIRVTVGCKKLVYQQGQINGFITDLQDYFKDPEGTQKKIFKRWGIEDDGLQYNTVNMYNGTISIG